MRPFSRPDLVLLHPPSVYDFRQVLTVPSPIADLIPSGPHFEMYPVGFSFLGEYLERNGVNVRVVNLAGRMLADPGFDAGAFLAKLRPLAFGVSFHWLPHAHGAIEVARLCKRLHPDVPVIMGGYSSTLFSHELMEYPEVDFILGGDSTEEPLLRLMECIAAGEEPHAIPNLTYRSRDGRVIENPISYVPADLDHLGENYRYMLRSAVKYGDIRGLRAFKDWWSYPLTAVMTCRGCSRDCTFCGGSAWSMRRCFARERPAFRAPGEVARDVETISRFTGAPIFVVGDLRQNGDEYAREVLDRLVRVSPRNHVVLELFEPAPLWFFRSAAGLPNFDLEISPESHDEEIRRAVGKRYTNEELELSIESALESGCAKVDVFFMIGLPRQTPASVMETVAWCARLLEDFGPGVNPLIGPLAPFLDPGSIAHENPTRNGYRLLFRSLDDYRNALLEPHWRDMLSYETEWMSRQEIVDATYAAALELNRVKRERGRTPPVLAGMIDRYIRDGMELLSRLDRAQAEGDAVVRERHLAGIAGEARSLHARSAHVKEELKWPIEGKRFRYGNILRLIVGGR